MQQTLRNRLDAVELHSLKASLPTGESRLHSMKGNAGSLARRAIARAGLEVKQAADVMGISASLLVRQLDGKEHLSWQRLFLLPDVVWRELLIVIAEERGVAKVRTSIDFEERQVG